MKDGDFAEAAGRRYAAGSGPLIGLGHAGSRGRNRYAAAAVLGLAAVFVIDLQTLLGIADGMLYALVVLLGLWRPERPFILSVAAAGVALTLLGWALSPSGGTFLVVAVNRIYSIILILGVAFAIDRYADYERGFHVLAQVVEQAPVGIVVTDVNGSIVYANPAMTGLSGHPRGELVGATPRIFASGRTPDDEYGRLWRTIKAGRSWEGDILNRRKNGEFVWEHEVIAPVRDGQGRISHYVGLKENITARKKLEEDLRFAHVVAEEANISKSAFLASMSHELRTPLNAILGFSEAIKMGIPAPLAHPKHVEYISLIHQSAGYLLQLINDILDLSKIESGAQAIEKARIDLPALVEACIRMVRERATRKNIRLDSVIAEGCPDLIADERMVKQIVLNLLTNAIKFTLEGGSVSLRGVPDGDGGLTIRIVDTGIGIQPEDMAKIFTPFARAEGDAYVRRQEGTGLGLMIARKMVELHGGSLTLDSALGVGTTATVRFPKARRVEPAGST